MEFTYLTQPPKRYTFQQPKLREWVEKRCKGKVLNLFAGTTKLSIDEVRVDIDKDVPAHYHMDALEFIDFAKEQGMKFDTIILDPPYNLRKSREKYGGKYIGSFTKIKEALFPIMSEGCIVLTFGYDTVGMSKKRGFTKIGVCVVCHNGDHNDTLCLMEARDKTLTSKSKILTSPKEKGFNMRDEENSSEFSQISKMSNSRERESTTKVSSPSSCSGTHNLGSHDIFETSHHANIKLNRGICSKALLNSK